MTVLILEREVEKKVRLYAQLKGVWYKKFVTPGYKFSPDRMLVAEHGTILMLEVKKPGEKPNGGQLRELERWRLRDIRADWFDNEEKGKALVDELVEYDANNK